MINKYISFIGSVAVLIFSSLTSVKGQRALSEERYIKDDTYYSDAYKWFEPWKNGVNRKSLAEIKAASALLTDEIPPATYIPYLKASSKVLSDENIYAKRKSGVFIVGKLTAADHDMTVLNLIGTAFAIAEDGVCVSNYHVLKNLIRPNFAEAKKDSMYFVITVDRKVYMIDEVLAFSQNNDLAVFKLKMNNDKLIPIPLGKPADVGAPVYCLAHPSAHFYNFTKGIVSRNVTIRELDLGEQYNKNGKPPIRMEITADYAVGASGGPILDKRGNVVGVVISTTPLSSAAKDEKGNDISHLQMTVKNTAPVKALIDLLKK